MRYLESFTPAQKNTYNNIVRLEKEMDNSAFYSCCIAIQFEIDKYRQECDHIFENGTCIVCGADQE